MPLALLFVYDGAERRAQIIEQQIGHNDTVQPPRPIAHRHGDGHDRIESGQIDQAHFEDGGRRRPRPLEHRSLRQIEIMCTHIVGDREAGRLHIATGRSSSCRCRDRKWTSTGADAGLVPALGKGARGCRGWGQRSYRKEYREMAEIRSMTPQRGTAGCPRLLRHGLLALALIVSGLGPGAVRADPLPQDKPRLPQPDHVVLVMEENQNYSAVYAAPTAPYLNSLARRGAVFTNSHALTHPSQPNYLALFAGTSAGLTDDSCPHQYAIPNLASELLAAGRTFVGYSEDLPAAGAQNCTAGLYARKHAPWVNFTNVPRTASQPWSAFPTDYSRLPTVAVVVPNLDHDMHNGSIRTGDIWLQQHLDAYVQWAQSHNSLLIVQWDEDAGTAANHILTLFVGPMVAPGEYGDAIPI